MHFEGYRDGEISKVNGPSAILTSRSVYHIEFLAQIDDARRGNQAKPFVVDTQADTNRRVFNAITFRISRVDVYAFIEGEW